MSSIVSYTFVILALMCWACRGWLLREGEERVVSTLAAVLVVGCVMQSVIGWLQYTGLAKHFTGYLMYRTGIVEGQLAQRNHFGHYLMWGVLSASWLWAQRRLPTILAAVCVLLFASTMSLTGSRTVLAYVLMLAVWLPICLLLGGRENRRTVVALAAGTFAVLIGLVHPNRIAAKCGGTHARRATGRLGARLRMAQSMADFLECALAGQRLGQLSAIRLPGKRVPERLPPL